MSHTDLLEDLLMTAWGVIANAGGGDWDTQTSEWRGAAEHWRDRYHATLPALSDT
ncbi:hypothetical protein LCGC14_2563340, partial [marine sediment metagenome]